jgi:hypothetical protein
MEEKEELKKSFDELLNSLELIKENQGALEGGFMTLSFAAGGVNTDCPTNNCNGKNCVTNCGKT